MKETYKVTGMTCSGCVGSVKKELLKVDGVGQVEVGLENGEAEISTEKYIPLQTLKSALPDKYSISEKGKPMVQIIGDNTDEKSKLQQLKPLLLIFLYLFSSAFLLNFRDWNTAEAMLDVMGLFYIVSTICLGDYKE